MKIIRRLLVRHAFKGGRFTDNGVDLDVLPDLVAYKNILVELAKELWKKKNPDRERLPWHFEESIMLKFYRIETGSAVVPIERVLEIEDQQELWSDQRDELDDAVDLLGEVASAAANDKPLPETFPNRILPFFETYGRTLREGEYFEYQVAGRAIVTRYNQIARARLAHDAEATYEDRIDLIGTVTMASIRKPRLGVTLQDGREIEANFKPEDEAIVLSALSEHNTAKVRLEGRGIFRGDGTLLRVLDTTTITLLPSGELLFVKDVKPIWEVFNEVIDKIPRKDLENFPKDGSINHDYYLYGLPKRAK
ncbi:MAG TPA: hypothetical protein VGR15_02315 [Bacteroidota bacterium]|nr:hypothetical protein [Bacteroidota bacterium]